MSKVSRRGLVAPLLCIAACSATTSNTRPVQAPTGPVVVNTAAVPPPTAPGTGARVRVVHASPDGMAANVVVYLDNQSSPAIPNIQYRQAVGYVEAAAGPHSVQARLPGFPPTSPPVLSWNTPSFAAGHAYTIVAHGLASDLSGPPVGFFALEDETTAPAPPAARARFFHALIGAHNVDICAGNAVVFGNVAYGRWGTGANGPYMLGPAGPVAFTVRTANDRAPCTGAALGNVSVTLPPGTNHTLIAVGAPSRRPSVPGEVLVCRDTPLEGPASCTPTPIAR